MFTDVYYVIGNADESDEYYLDTIGDDQYHSRERAEQEILNLLNDWGYAEGYTRADYDIAKITIIVERE